VIGWLANAETARAMLSVMSGGSVLGLVV